MKSTAEHPFAFFDWYLETGIYKDLKEFYNHNVKNNFLVKDGLLSCKVDKDNHIIYFTNVAMIDEMPKKFTHTFNKVIKDKFDVEIINSLKFIEYEFQKRFSNKNELKAYTDFLIIKLGSYSRKKTFNEFPIIPPYFDKFEDLLSQYSKKTISYQFIPSFDLLAESKKEQKLKINTLYNLLIEKPSMINSTKEEFYKAFKGQEIDEGIHWLVKGKNKLTSKVSLFYMLEELIKNNFISKSTLNDLSKFVKYVFRDNEGNEFKNLKQSKATYSESVSSKNRIDNIISSL